MRRPTPDPIAPGQESVWDYPRPPAVRPVSAQIEVRLGGRVVCRSDHALQVLETSHPPTWYLPREAFVAGALRLAVGTSVCEFKGIAQYLDVRGGEVVAPAAAWTYPEPWAGYEALVQHIALYPGLMEQCTVDGEVVRAQPGGFYGGWMTDRVAGPVKGGPGSMVW